MTRRYKIPKRVSIKHHNFFSLAVILFVAAVGSLLQFRHTTDFARRTAPSMASVTNPDYFSKEAGQSLINLHDDSHIGWRFKSGIQSPHYQTDRDVGAASVGMGFLALADRYPEDQRWLHAAEQTAAWLQAVSDQDGHGGIFWPDYVDYTGTSGNIYTSFDDGSIGIGDFFWQLYAKTNNQNYKSMALGTLQWTLSHAEPSSDAGVTSYRWRWDMGEKNSPYNLGMGEGQVGIINTLAVYYERLKSSNPDIAKECKKYIDGGLIGLEAASKNLANNGGDRRTIPETGIIGQDGDTTMDSGYLSGAAGEAYLYLNLHRVFGDKQYMDKAEGVLSWLSDSKQGPAVQTGHDSVAWRLAIDPQNGNNNSLATGVEEGAAGIGWTFLQAYRQSGDKVYLSEAEAAGNWLLGVAIKYPGGGLAWHEDEQPVNILIRPNLNNGAAGIGMFLHDLYLETKDQRYETGARGAYSWLLDNARHQAENIYWKDNDEGTPFQNDPSWHWGLAGIIEFSQRLSGGQQDILGEQPNLPLRASRR